MFQYVIDENIILKNLVETDAAELFALTDRSRDSLREWLPWLDGTKTEADSFQFIQNAQASYGEKKSLICGIFYQGKLAGIAGFNSIDWMNQNTYIGYWLGTDFQGNGIMTNTVKALIDYAFAQLQLNRIEIRAAIGNTKSRAIPERLRFKEEGLIRQSEWLYDHFVDHIIYGMLKTDWQ